MGPEKPEDKIIKTNSRDRGEAVRIIKTIRNVLRSRGLDHDIEAIQAYLKAGLLDKQEPRVQNAIKEHMETAGNLNKIEASLRPGPTSTPDPSDVDRGRKIGPGPNHAGKDDGHYYKGKK